MLKKVTKKSWNQVKVKNYDTNHIWSLRVKLTYTFSGAGVMAPIFSSILGLNERERYQSNNPFL